MEIIEELGDLKPCCGLLLINGEVFYFDDFEKVEKIYYDKIFYFMEEESKKEYSLNEESLKENLKFIENMKIHKKEEFSYININIID